MREPDFTLFLNALKGAKTPRPVLFDFLISEHIAAPLAGKPADGSPLSVFRRDAKAYALLGYDYALALAPGFGFAANTPRSKESACMNDTCVIRDRRDFERYEWPEPDDSIPEFFEAAGKCLPDGMKLIVHGPNGVLEITSALFGFDNLMFMLYDDPGLVKAVTDEVGSRLLRYYELALQVGAVGAIICNDDWGFKTQTMMSPAHMREYVFPWHKTAVEAARAAGRPAVLHSCGDHRGIMEDIIGDMGYAGKHSYEDNIQPVEEAYGQYGRRIGILGGMDMDFLCRARPEEVYQRARRMLLLSRENGRYLLGTGNSLARFLPLAQYNAMRRAAFDLENEW